MLGKLLNSLNYLVEKDIKKWKKNNEVMREYAWRQPQKAIMALSRHPVRNPFIGFVVVLLLSFFVACVCNFLHTFIPPQNPGNLQERIGQYFTAAWAVQATIVALIYPIVIGFMSILLQRGHSPKAILNIYLHESMAVLSGMSSLFLVLFMAIQLFFAGKFGVESFHIFFYVDLVWLGINVLFTMWFIERTFSFLRTENRKKIIKSHVLNRELPNEVRRNLRTHIYLNAVELGLIPRIFSDETSQEDEAIIYMGPYVEGWGTLQVTCKNKNGYIVSNVHFRLLCLAVTSLNFRRKFSLKFGKITEKNKEDYEQLVLPTLPGDVFNSKSGICRTKNIELNCIERLLIRASLSFSKKPYMSSDFSISSVFSDMKANLITSIQENEGHSFNEAMQEVIDFHADLIKASTFVNKDGYIGSYSLLSNTNSVFGLPLHKHWTREYLILLKKVTEKLTFNKSYFIDMAKAIEELADKLDLTRPAHAYGDPIFLAWSLHDFLSAWWSKTVANQNAINSAPLVPSELNEPMLTTYKEVIGEFVGYWELLGECFPQPLSGKFDLWDDLKELSGIYASHVNHTFYMLFSSVSVGNVYGAEWLCDSLSKWTSIFGLASESALNTIFDSHRLTLDCFNTAWENVAEVVNPRCVEGGMKEQQKKTWIACFCNYLTDICNVSLYALIQLGKESEEDEKNFSMLVNLVDAIAHGKNLREGHSDYIFRPTVKNIDDFMISVLRQYFFGKSINYQDRLNNVIENSVLSETPKMIPGRHYSWTPSFWTSKLIDGQLILLCLLIKKEWKRSDRLSSEISFGAKGNAFHLGIYREGLENWSDRLKHGKPALTGQYGTIYSRLQSSFGTELSLEDAIDALLAGINELIEFTKSIDTSPP